MDDKALERRERKNHKLLTLSVKLVFSVPAAQFDAAASWATFNLQSELLRLGPDGNVLIPSARLVQIETDDAWDDEGE